MGARAGDTESLLEDNLGISESGTFHTLAALGGLGGRGLGLKLSHRSRDGGRNLGGRGLWLKLSHRSRGDGGTIGDGRGDGGADGSGGGPRLSGEEADLAGLELLGALDDELQGYIRGGELRGGATVAGLGAAGEMDCMDDFAGTDLGDIVDITVDSIFFSDIFYLHNYSKERRGSARGPLSHPILRN